MKFKSPVYNLEQEAAQNEMISASSLRTQKSLVNDRCLASNSFQLFSHKLNKMSNLDFITFFLSCIFPGEGGKNICDLSTRESPEISVNPN